MGNDLYVFNIKGNDYRLIVRIIFRVRTIYKICRHAQGIR
ncbi:type II toxin-antitoxin system HigB family toxin [Pseudoflavitalea rhizosphaerae]